MNTNPEYAEFVKAANQNLVDLLITRGVGAMCATMELYIERAAQIGGTGGFASEDEPVVTTNPLVYAPGTRVRYNGSGGSVSKAGKETIIAEVNLDDSQMVEYATKGAAWIPHAELDWVADPTPESLQELRESKLSEWESYHSSETEETVKKSRRKDKKKSKLN